jgi:hypothetical protein
MRQVPELLLCQPLVNLWMPGAYDANETDAEKPLLENVQTAHIGEITNRQINLPLLKRGHQVPGWHRHGADINSRCIGHQPAKQLRQQCHLADIGHRDREATAGARRVEAGRRQHMLAYVRQNRLDHRRQLHRSRGRLHPGRHLHEQRIADPLA